MQQVVEITGMHCGACVARVKRALETVTGKVTVSLDPPRAVLEVTEPVGLDRLASVVSQAGYEIKRAG